MQITVKVSAEVARSLHFGAAQTADSRALLRAAEDMGTALEPMHPGSDDPLLAPYFVAQVPEGEEAEQVIARLLGCSAIEAAYLKPPDEMP